MSNKLLECIFLLAIIFIFSSCQQNTQREMNPAIDAVKTENNSENIEKAVCVLHPTDGNEVTGIVTFIKAGDEIKVTADIKNLPGANHGIHIHEYGDCSASDASSAGGHFNPENVQHGARTDSIRHVGDLGNIQADGYGNAHLEFTDSFISFSGKHSIIGKAVIVHEKADDLKSQPTGNAGSRIACGVVGISK